MAKSANRQKALSVLKMAGITKAPVDMDKVARALGFTIIPHDFPEDTSGVIFIEGKTKSIGVNKNHSLNRQRFTAAHEFGHYLNGHQHYDGEGKIFEDKEFDYLNPQHRQEKEADAFAAELLMPKHFLEKDLAKYRLDLPKLTGIYQVSEQAMWIRLTSLRLAEKYAAK